MEVTMRQKSLVLTTITRIAVLAVLALSTLNFGLLAGPAAMLHVPNAVEDAFHRAEFSSAGVTFLVKDTKGGDRQDGFQFRFRSAAVGNTVRSVEGSEATEPVSQGEEVFYARS